MACPMQSVESISSHAWLLVVSQRPKQVSPQDHRTPWWRIRMQEGREWENLVTLLSVHACVRACMCVCMSVWDVSTSMCDYTCLSRWIECQDVFLNYFSLVFGGRVLNCMRDSPILARLARRWAPSVCLSLSPSIRIVDMHCQNQTGSNSDPHVCTVSALSREPAPYH